MEEETIITPEKTPDVETPEPSAESTEQSPPPEISILELLGEPTEPKPEYFESEEPINEDLPDFDPPPAEEPDAPSHVIDPDKTLQKKVSLPSATEEKKFMAEMIVIGVDTARAWALGKFVAKDNKTEEYLGDDDLNDKFAKAMAKYLADKNVEMSPFMEMMFAFGMSSAGPVMTAFENAKLQKELHAEKSKNEILEKREKEREQREREKEDLQQKQEIADLKAKLAKTEVQAAQKTVKAKELTAKTEKPAKRKTPKTAKK